MRIILILFLLLNCSNLFGTEDYFDKFMRRNNYKYPHEHKDKSLNKDSLRIDFYLKKVSAYLSANIDTSIYYLDKVEKELKIYRNDKLNVRFSFNKANYNYLRSQFKLAIEDYKNTLELAKIIEDSITIGRCYINLATSNYYDDNYYDFIKYANMAIDWNKNLKNYNGNMIILELMMNYYMDEGDLDYAEKIVKELMQNAELTKNYISIPWSKKAYVDYLLRADRLEEARKILDEIRPIADTLYYKTLKQEVYSNYVRLMIKMNDKIGLKVFLDSLINHDYKSIVSENDLITLNLIASGLIKLNNYSAAKPILQDVYKKIDSTISLSTKIDVLNNLIEVGKYEKDYKNTVQYLEEKIIYEDSLNKKIRNSIVRKKEIELKVNHHEILLEKREAEANAYKSSIIILALTIILVLIILGIIIFYYNNKKKQLAKQHQAEIERNNYEKEKLNELLKVKEEGLKSQALIIAEYLDKIDKIHIELDKAKEENDNLKQNKELKSIDLLIEELSSENVKEKFRDNFEAKFLEIYPDYFERIKEQFSDITRAELRICALIKLNFDSKGMANILGISPASVDTQRSRIRKKMNLDKNQNLYDFIQKL